MSRNKAFWRKVTYLGLIAVLFVPISRLSAPATTESEGGTLAQMRKEDRLSQAQLGKIDPASASMSLATLGMRGVAANLLWGRAFHYQKTENYDAQLAVLGQIAKLQPNYVAVWQHQAWNVSYNVSVEFDDYRHRYEWVKKGLDYLREGITFNRDEPLLYWDSGWFFGHKIGKSDEYLQFRRLFRADEDFHRELPVDLDVVRGPDSRPDNWKVAHEWFKSAQKIVDAGASLSRLATHYLKEDKEVIDKKKTPLRGKNPLVFHSDPPKALINYADAIQKDGYLDEVSLLAWRRAGQEWNVYGDRPILSTFGFVIRLNEEEARREEVRKANEEFEKLLPGLREQLLQTRLAALSDAQRALLNRDPLTLSKEEADELTQVQERLKITPTQVAQEAPADVEDQALRLARRIEENQDLADVVGRYREVVNYMNWKLRCEAEQQANTLQARKLTYDAEQAYKQSDLQTARTLFEQAWDRWHEFFQTYPVFLEDVEGEIVVESVIVYKKTLDQLNEPFPPEGFKLMDLIRYYGDEYPEIALPEEQTTGPGASPATSDSVTETADDSDASLPAEPTSETSPSEASDEDSGTSEPSEPTAPEEREADAADKSEKGADFGTGG